ncbi:MAG: hypothetical protein JO356_14480 [Acidobacteria bacterium]|nr:hypothetical protein [Acidobacteriota bacterium]
MKRTSRFFALSLLTLSLLSIPQSAAQNSDQPQASQDQRSSSDEAKTITLPEGTVISVRIADDIHSNHNHRGDFFTGTVDPSVLVDNHVVIPRGTEAHLQMAVDKKGGHLHGKAEVELELISLVVGGENISAESDIVKKKKGALSTKATAAAAAAAKPGAVGAAGAAASVNPIGAASVGAIAVFKAPKVEIKAGTRIAFTLTSPFTFDSPTAAALPATENNPK